MIQKIDQSTCHTILIPANVDQCSLMLSSRLRTRLIQPFLLEEVAEKVSVDHAQWTSMEDIILLASAPFQKETLRNLPSHHLCSCLFLRIWWQTCLISMLNINLLTHSSRERLRRLKDKENIFKPQKTENYLTGSTNAFSAHVANQHAHHIGGIHRTISVRLFLCKLIDGLLIPEMSILTKDLRSLEEIWNLENAIKSVFVL